MASFLWVPWILGFGVARGTEVFQFYWLGVVIFLERDFELVLLKPWL